MLDSLFDLCDDPPKGPLGQVGRRPHALLLALKFHFLDLLEEVAHLQHRGTALAKALKHFLVEVSVWAIF